MEKKLPTKAQVVIIGGGIHGCSVAYHLAKEGWADVVLLERKTIDQWHHVACCWFGRAITR